MKRNNSNYVYKSNCVSVTKKYGFLFIHFFSVCKL